MRPRRRVSDSLSRMPHGIASIKYYHVPSRSRWTAWRVRWIRRELLRCRSLSFHVWALAMIRLVALRVRGGYSALWQADVVRFGARGGMVPTGSAMHARSSTRSRRLGTRRMCRRGLDWLSIGGVAYQPWVYQQLSDTVRYCVVGSTGVVLLLGVNRSYSFRSGREDCMGDAPKRALLIRLYGLYGLY